MTEISQVYKCNICGNIVEVLHSGAGELVCCGKPMKLMEENTVDAAVEKHIPVIELTEGGFRVVVGSTEHPMNEDHYIEWIEFIDKGIVYRKNLKPGESPEAFFAGKADNACIRAYCNLHGLWKAK